MEHVFASLPHFLGAAALLALAEAVYVMFGFGAGLIAVGTLCVFMPNVQDVVVLLLLVNLPAELYVVWTNRDKIAWRGVLLIIVGMSIGVPLGTRILQTSEPTFLLTVLGGFLVVAGTGFLFATGRWAIRWPLWVGPPVGLVAGVLAGLFGTGGPPLIFYYRLSGVDKAVFRGSLMAIFLAVTVVRIPTYAISGLLTLPRLQSSLLVLPAVLAGAWLGQRAQLRTSEETFRKLVSGALVLIGVALLAQQLR